MKKLAQVAATLILAAVALAGCGDGDENGGDAKSAEPSPTRSEAIEDTDWGRPATGPQIAGDGYTYSVPKTWADITTRARSLQASVDTAASEKAATDSPTTSAPGTSPRTRPSTSWRRPCRPSSRAWSTTSRPCPGSPSAASSRCATEDRPSRPARSTSSSSSRFRRAARSRSSPSRSAATFPRSSATPSSPR